MRRAVDARIGRNRGECLERAPLAVARTSINNQLVIQWCTLPLGVFPLMAADSEPTLHVTQYFEIWMSSAPRSA